MNEYYRVGTFSKRDVLADTCSFLFILFNTEVSFREVFFIFYLILLLLK